MERHVRWLTVLALLGLQAVGSASAVATGAGQVCAGSTCTVTFGYTGAAQAWTVPVGVTSATFTVDGASGGDGPNGGGSGGWGAEVTATAATTPGTPYTLSVGGAGQTSGAGGTNGGGAGGSGGEGAGGGGYTAVLSGGAHLVVAGGGGGGGGEGGGAYGIGDAGGRTGNVGGTSCTDGDPAASGGGGGTATAGGAGGVGPTGDDGNPGSALTGGGGPGPGTYAGGGGGGGWYGGGEGGLSPGLNHACGAGGGGGSSHVAAGLGSVSYATGAWGGDGRVVVTYPDPVTAADGSARTGSGTTLSVGAAGGVLTHAGGPGTLTASAGTPATHGSATVSPDGSFRYTPAAGYVGSDAFGYRATDAAGDYAVGTITLTVDPTVTFVATYGVTVGRQVVPAGTDATMPTAPTRTGYAFLGWFTALSGGQPFGFSTPITADRSLYAHWKPVAPAPTPTPTASPSPTPSLTPSPAPTSTPAVTPVRAPTTTTTPAPTPTTTPAPTHSPTTMPTPTLAPTPTPSHRSAPLDGSGPSGANGARPSALTHGTPSIWTVLRHPERIGWALAAGLVWTLLLLLASSMLAQSLKARYGSWTARVRGWLPARGRGPWGDWPRRLLLLGLLLANAVILGFVDPAFGLNATSGRLLASTVLASLVATVLPYAVVAAICRRRWQIPVVVRPSAWGTVLCVGGVVVSRLIGFVPGILSASSISSDLGDAGVQARVRHARTYLVLLLALAAGCWTATSWLPGHGDAVALWVHDAMVAATLIALISSFIDLLPLTFLSGGLLLREARASWVVLTALSAVGVVLVVVPQPRYWLYVGPRATWWVVVATVVICCALVLVVLTHRSHRRVAVVQTVSPSTTGS